MEVSLAITLPDVDRGVERVPREFAELERAGSGDQAAERGPEINRARGRVVLLLLQILQLHAEFFNRRGDALVLCG